MWRLFYQLGVQAEFEKKQIQVLLVEVARLDRLHRKDERLGGILGVDLFGFGQVQGGQSGIEMEVQTIRIACLTVSQSGILF